LKLEITIAGLLWDSVSVFCAVGSQDWPPCPLRFCVSARNMNYDLYPLSLEINEFTVYDVFFFLVDVRWARLAQIIEHTIPILIFGLGPV